MTGPRLIVLAALAGLLVTLAIIWQYPPGHGSFYPQCLMRKFTGLYCPGCGTGRALHDLLHLRFTEGFWHNPLLVLLLPLLAYWGGGHAWLALRYNRWDERQPPGRVVQLLLAVLIGYFIARNLPGESLAWLRP